MRLADCDGVIAVAIGSFLAILVRLCDAIGGNQSDRLAWLNNDLTKWYSGRYVSRIGVLKIDNIPVKDSWPVLHGPAVKSAATRNMLPWCLGLALKFCKSGSRHDSSVVKVMQSLSNVTDVLYNAGFFLRPKEQQVVADNVSRLARHWQWLAKDSEQRGELSWHVTYKLHGYMHVPFYSSLMNMRYVQNYLE